MDIAIDILEQQFALEDRLEDIPVQITELERKKDRLDTRLTNLGDSPLCMKIKEKIKEEIYSTDRTIEELKDQERDSGLFLLNYYELQPLFKEKPVKTAEVYLLYANRVYKMDLSEKDRIVTFQAQETELMPADLLSIRENPTHNQYLYQGNENISLPRLALGACGAFYNKIKGLNLPVREIIFSDQPLINVYEVTDCLL
ncbi:MAG: hypothetical protein ABIJ08_00590 [Nanoarchaeota archaeon]